MSNFVTTNFDHKNGIERFAPAIRLGIIGIGLAAMLNGYASFGILSAILGVVALEVVIILLNNRSNLLRKVPYSEIDKVMTKLIIHDNRGLSISAREAANIILGGIHRTVDKDGKQYIVTVDDNNNPVVWSR